ncbi:MAG TPA: hypothetical protein PKV16_04240 [Caldisericia bacterium]|nr:hypothetical protein [Caldisericia bacterium]HPF48518.1 hypothetical protein [Caldisericia bacterium]HPI84612.1 hypothetical protein [Caldisericia bacterium]HPQ92973.1 hypothetical protein [Caldisericia bacterium]HRV75193.1 hypothetical protein [Caldisericia bacterium]
MKNIWKIIISSTIALVLLCGVVVLSTQADEEIEKVGTVGLDYLPIEATSYSQFFTNTTLADMLEHELVNTFFTEFPEYDFRDGDVDYSVLKFDGFSIGDESESTIFVFDIESEDSASWTGDFINSLADMFMFEVEEKEGGFWVIEVDYDLYVTIRTTDNKLFIDLGQDSSLLDNCLATKEGNHDSFKADPEWAEIERIMGGTPSCGFNRFAVDQDNSLTIASSSRGGDGEEYADVELVGGINAVKKLVPEEYTDLFNTFIANQSDVSGFINTMPDALLKMAMSSLYWSEYGFDIPYGDSGYDIKDGSTAYSVDIDFMNFMPKTCLGWFGSMEDIGLFRDKYLPEDEVELEEIEDEEGIYAMSPIGEDYHWGDLSWLYNYVKISDTSMVFSEKLNSLKAEPEIVFPLSGEGLVAAHIDLNPTIDELYDLLVMSPINDEKGMMTLKECMKYLSEMNLTASARLYLDGEAVKIEFRMTY